ncbi:hypothetical protein CLAFUW4_09735 [Fulvia fulva]|uniref:Uncharacterized protein n=1 Tax=Passalora fulva TaxID=5499 RepID=A0A9Q8PIT5_PASFU|nr:uncharacterized protein CLAFUR5_12503 [Fulvia fulva]KAK4616177.1 hypothetical protein CLAFUR4_09740 [Fulvia fulva]KAK4616501.1 hypothetical protein CLAFUR0_09732 [Fulvia fulva]UJO23179.1 hypothetical protein CLAFUR5_12503 [Fulvia fulva]WPV19197.1 hypothetical protein CLAFUW4_09735 [Fulvia fulva]WPV34231.1 hypothetical protein CLAFUW7_09737 [Fulvia fulva]
MSAFSPLGAFATFAAYQRLQGSQEAQDLYQLIYHPETSEPTNSSPSPSGLPLYFRLARYLFSITLAAAVGGRIVGIHGHLLPTEQKLYPTSTVPETISMLWLAAMCVIALFGLDGNLGLGLFGTAWWDMVDWVHEQARGEGY